MKGTIKAPKGIITGAFSVIFSFIREVDLTRDGVLVEVIKGDALGHQRDNFGGSGKNYHLLCHLQDGLKGRSRISVTGHAVAPVEIAYDTVRSIVPVWGDPFVRNGKIEIPLSLPTPVTNLRKRNFRVSRAPARCHLYGAGTDYQVVVSPSGTGDFTVSVAGTVEKENGLAAVIQETVVEVSG